MANSRRDPERYREEAARFREMAAAATDSAPLRDSYLALSIGYERLADVLERALAASPPIIAGRISGAVSDLGDAESSAVKRHRSSNR